MKKVILTLVIVLAIPIQVLADSADQPSSWAKDSINTIVAAQIIDMDRFQTYKRPITRIEYGYLIYQLYEYLSGEPILASVDMSVSTDFTDLYTEEDLASSETGNMKPQDNLYLKGLKGAGLITGYPDGTYRPGDYITREEIMTLYVRTLEKAGYTLEAGSHSFADAERISSWAESSVLKCYELGIVNGVGNNRISPKGYATVEESLVVFSRILNNQHFTETRQAVPTSSAKMVSDGRRTYGMHYNVFGEPDSIRIYEDYTYLSDINYEGGIVDAGLILSDGKLYFWDRSGKLLSYDGDIVETGFMSDLNIDAWYMVEGTLYFAMEGVWSSYNISTGKQSISEEPESKAAVIFEGGALLYKDHTVMEGVIDYDTASGKTVILSADHGLYVYDEVSKQLYSYGHTTITSVELSWNYLIVTEPLINDTVHVRYIPAFDIESYVSP